METEDVFYDAMEHPTHFAGVLFATIGGNKYPNYWHPQERDVFSFYGQKSGKLDHLIVPGQWLACKNKPTTPYDVVGKVTHVRQVHPRSDTSPALYRLTIDRQHAKGVIPKKEGDKYYQSEVHRVLGGNIPNPDNGVYPAIPNGIYPL